MSRPRIIIVVEGGGVQNVISDQPVEVSLIDHDNLADGGSIVVGDLPVEHNPNGVERFYADPYQYAGS